MKSAWSIMLASLVIGAGCGGAESGADGSDGAIGTAEQAVSGKNLFNSATVRRQRADLPHLPR